MSMYCSDNITVYHAVLLPPTVLFALIKSKCLPILLYGVEACPTNSADKQSLQFTMNRVLFKIFRAMKLAVISEYIL